MCSSDLSYANSGFAVANSGSSYANSAFLQANTPSYTANSAASYANAAFAKANTATASTYGFYQFVGDGATTDFVLSTTPSANTVLINYNGVLQLTNSYSVSGSTVSFTEPPSSSANIEVIVLTGGGGGGGSSVSNTSIRSQAMTMGIIFGG